MQEGMPMGVGPLDYLDIHRKDIVDPAEKLVAKLGTVEDAMDEIEKGLQKNPNDEELLRQARLLEKRSTDILKKAEELRERMNGTIH